MRCPSLPLTVVLVAFAVGACTADKANPILPSTGNSNSWVASGSFDAQMDGTADGATDAYADVSVGDSAPGSCNLLMQNCAPGEACYPTSDVGKCQSTDGTVGALGSCVLDPFVCAPGYACVPLKDMGSTCVQICDVSHPQAVCTFGFSCQPRWVGDTVGSCDPA